MLRFLSKLLMYLTCAWLVSCVGTVDELKEDTQKSVLDNPYEISFDGVLSGVATAHNKVRLYFKPAQGGSGTFSYNAYVNGNYSTAQGSTSDVTPDEEGNLHIDVEGLSTGQTHSILVRAFDIQNNVEDQNNKLLALNTLPYEVPIFDGVNLVENLAGIDGETKLKASWIKANASSTSGGFGANPNDVSGYNIYLGLSAESLSLIGTVNDPDITDYILSGLNPQTKYYIKVLARNSQTPVQLEDQNVEVKSLSTLSPLPINFVGVKSLSIPTTSQGFSKINLNWDLGSGGFDRYRIFVKTDPSAPDPAVDTAHSADITDLTLTSTQISVANPYTLYYVTMVACDGVACNDYQGQNVNLPITTTPPIAPFNGITTLEQASGQFGLTQLEASWFAPDTTQGVYDTIRLYETTAAGVVGSQVPACSGGTSMCYEVVAGTKWKIVNLTQGQEYCFMAKAFSTSPFKADEPSGRTHANESYKCATPSYREPGFSGPAAGCTDPTSTGLTVNWDAPVPFGTFEQFELYYKSTPGPFSFTQAISGHVDYTKVSVASSATAWSLTGLNPSTTYQIGLKTYLEDPDNPGSGFRDSNNNIVTCETNDATATHNGWFNVLALGPKIDGRNGLVVPERYRDRDTTQDPPIYIPYPQEFKTGDPSKVWPDTTAVTTSGMVVLKWDDFMIEGVGTMYSIKDNHADNGYNVYRKEYVPAHDTLPPTIDDLSASALSSWTKVNEDIIKPTRHTVRSSVDANIMYERDMGMFVDYTVEQSTDPNTTKTYWYLITANLGGTTVAWSTTPDDGLLEVIVPPNNMGFMHRWLANRTMCDLIRRDVDRSNHYRCEYNGLASTYDSGTGKDYYDMGKHVLFSRFHIGTNFTRTEVCNDIGGAYHNRVQGDAPYLGFDGDKNGDNLGACIGTSNRPHGLIEAPTGTIFYDRYRAFTYFNSTGGDYSNPVTGTSWRRIDENDNSATNIVTPLSSFYVTNNVNPWSLNSHLPHAYPMSWTRNQVACYFNELNHKSSNYRLRSLRRKELMPLSAYSPYLTRNGNSNSIQYFIEGRMHENDSHRLDCVGRYRRDELQNIETTLNNDFSANGNDKYPLYGGRRQSDNIRIIQDTIASGSSEARSNPILASASSGEGSTEMCVSRFGMSEPINSYRRQLGDSFWVSKSLAGMHAGYFVDEGNPGNLTKRTPANDPHLSWDEDVIEDWKNGNGIYYNTITATGSDFQTGYQSVARNLAETGLDTFYNPILGLHLTCSGTSCINNASPDDNQLFSTRTSGTTATFKGYNQVHPDPYTYLAGINEGEFSLDNFTMSITFGGNFDNYWNRGPDTLTFNDRSNGHTNSGYCAIQVPSYGD